MIPRAIFSLLITYCCLFCGCGSPSPPPLVPVKGKLTVQGAPLTSGRVVFRPLGPGEESRADVTPQGEYVMKTGDREGVPAGKYAVLVFAMSPESEADSTKPPVWLANMKYTQPTSELTVEVAPSTPPEKYVFDLEK